MGRGLQHVVAMQFTIGFLGDLLQVEGRLTGAKEKTQHTGTEKPVDQVGKGACGLIIYSHNCDPGPGA